MIKQESSFDAAAGSSAGARGLTQVIPSTGAAIASNLGKPSFNASDLFLPYTSIEFGAYYLANRMHDYNNEVCQALAAYNGGAGNVTKWATAHPPSLNLDDFVENIQFGETREYVKIVYTNYAVYRQIYAAKAER
jgi:soluble lytic murein transglycosylase